MRIDRLLKVQKSDLLRQDNLMVGNRLNVEPSESFSRPKSPLVSVIIPIFNGSQYVGNLFSSLTQQIFTDFEVIFIDDGSSDDTFQQIQKEIQACKQLNVRVIRSSHQGLAATRNIGIRSSMGSYLTFLDCDDSWQNNKLKSQVEFISQSNCVAVFSKVRLVSVDGIISLSEFNKQTIAMSPLDLITRKFIVYGGGSNIMCKREIFDEVGVFDETLKFAEDFDMWLRISKEGKIVQIPERLVDILVRPNSMQRIRSVRTKFGLLNSRIAILFKWIGEYPNQIKNEIAYTMAEELYEAVKELDLRYIILILVVAFKPNIHAPVTPIPFWFQTRLLLLTIGKLHKLIVRRILGRLKKIFLLNRIKNA